MKDSKKIKRWFSFVELSVAQILIAVIIIMAFIAVAIFWDVLFDAWNFAKFYVGF